MKLKVNVTEDDIKNGTAGDGYHCPIALALKRVIPEGKTFTVGDDVFIIDPKYLCDTDIVVGGRLELAMPQEIQDFIYHFDDRDLDLCHPFEFELELSISCVVCVWRERPAL